jgi:branched-chain amino acid transport system permease protein
MMRGADLRRHAVAGVLFAGALASWWFAGYAGQDRLSEIAVWAIFAMGLDILVGYAGLVSLGHALFFGVGAYGMAVLTVFLKWPAGLALPASVLLAGATALLVGLLAVRVAGVFFIMITLAFGQMGWAYLVRARGLGGIGGISGVIPLDLGALGLNLANPAHMTLVTIVAAGLVYLALARVTASPFGRMLVAIHQNESRARALGLPIRRYKLAAFTLAGAVAGLAGTLAAERTAFVSPDLLVWTTSGEGLIMVIVGGLGTVVGPAAGAAIWVVLRHYLSGLTPYWMLPMGLFFVAVVLFAGNGLYALIARTFEPRPIAPPAAGDA